ncbi:DUF6221 family protein [Streptomyces sp. NPDC001422]|uniref:DUF6221 family protein n=1 Tax=Streptomyces sp. NPDC001422 TaxID=3364575 RepID=UPI0036C03DE5
MDDLAEWYGAQLDEDERTARACSGDGKWTADDIAIYGQDLGVEVRAHMAVHDPARVLREIEAKRELLDEHQDVNDGYCGTCVDGQWGYPTHGGSSAQRFPCRTLRLLATVYRDRPGYRAEEWAP